VIWHEEADSQDLHAIFPVRNYSSKIDLLDMCCKDFKNFDYKVIVSPIASFLCGATAVVLLLLFDIPAEAQSSAPSVNTLVQELRKGDNEQALSIAEKLLATAPEDCRVLSLEAVAFAGLNRQTDALGAFKKATTQCPDYLPALEGAAQIEYAAKSDEAVPTLGRILSIQPANVTAQAMLASALRVRDRCPDALSHYEASSSLLPSRPDLLQGYASCLAQVGDFKSALIRYLDLLQANPTDITRSDVALLHWKTGASQAALETLSSLLAAGRFEPAFGLAAHISEELGDTPRAVSLLRTAIQLAPDKIDNYLDFSNIAFNHKSFQVGIDMLNVGLQRSPSAAPLYLARGVMEVQLTKNDAAVSDFEQAHRLDPKLSFAVDAMGIMNSQQHNNAASLALFQSQAKVHPDDPLLQYLLAEQLSQSATDDNDTQLQAAVAAAEHATKLDPGYELAHDLLATLYLRAKQPELAIKEAEIALATDPNDEGALFQELKAKRRSGDTASIQELTERLKAARIENAKKQQITARYQLQDDVGR
jgi:tetratricopeptide (TPR) repeat protein